MKNSILLLAVFGMALFYSSCTETKHIQARRAAVVTLPADLDTVIIVNKTKLKKGNGNQAVNVLEGILTGEPILGDRYGANSATENMEKLIRESDRLDLAGADIIQLESEKFLNEKPLEGDFLDSICKEYNADGVIALENFDTDNLTPLYNAPGTNSSTADAKALWRIYYKDERKIIDESWISARGSDYSYYSIVPTQYTAISRAGAFSADIYLSRITPRFQRESRVYYKSGSSEMKAAKRSVRIGDWDQAQYLWEVEAESAVNDKDLGRAAYNLALAFELKDDFDNALEWIDASITAGNKRAYAYKEILMQRAHEKKIIDEQLKRE